MSWLDSPPYPFHDQQGQRLLAILTEAYSAPAAARACAEDAGIRRSLVNWDAAIKFVWRDVLAVAADQGCLRALVGQAGADPAIKGYHQRLKDLIAAADRGAGPVAGQLVIGEIPRQSVGFVDRDTVDRLAQAVQRDRIAVVCAVTGMRGIGKTQVAAAYARRRIADGWGLIGWVNAETRDTLLTGLDAIAHGLGVADPDGDPAASAERLRTALTTRKEPGLLVFDNAIDPDLLYPFLPTAGHAQMVITSTDPGFRDLGEPVGVDTFTREESVNYLRQRTGVHDDEGAAAVAAELGDLPLALAQAAATMSSRYLTYSRYLDKLHTFPVDQLLTASERQGYPASAAAALLLSVDAAEAGDPSGSTSLLLGAIALLSPDGVRRKLLDDLTFADDTTVDVDTALGRATTGSLLTWSVADDAVIMHRLVGRIIRERNPRAEPQTNAAHAAVQLLDQHCFDERQAWSRRSEGAELVDHIEELWTNASDVDDANLILRILRLRSWGVRQLRAARVLARAIDIGTATLNDIEGVLGPAHPDTLSCRNNLAHAYETAGRIDQAIPLYEAALADRERIQGVDHPDTLTSRNNLGLAYQAAGQLDRAVTLNETTVTDHERILGPDHPHTLTCRNNLALAYQAAGQLDRAIPLHETTLADHERILGPDHPHTLTCRNNLADAYLAAGRLDQAIPLHETALADRERILGADHPDTLTSRNNLAGAHRAAGRLDQAIPLHETTLADHERILGPDHPHTLTSRNNLANVYRSAGQLDQAIALYEATLADRERVLGRDHPDTRASREDLGLAYEAAGRPDDAQALLDRSEP